MRQMKLPLKSVTQKVLIILVIGIVFIMATAGGAYYAAEKQKALRRIQEIADKTGDRISNSLIHPMWNISQEEMEKTLALEMAEENIIAIVLNDEDHHFLMGKIKDLQGRVVNYAPDKNPDIRIKNCLVSVKKNILKGSEYLGEVNLFFTDHYLQKYLNDLIIKIFLLTVLLSVFTVFIIFVSLKKIILTPLFLLQNATQHFKTALSGEGDKNYRVMIGTGDEIDKLGENFNTMADDLIRSQEQLQYTVGRLQTLTDETPDAVISITADGKISDVNKTFLKMFGGTYDEFLGSPINDLGLKTDSGDMIQEKIDRVIQGHNIDFEWIAERKSGESFPVDVRFRLMELGDEHLILGVITDITARKQAEEKLSIKTEELEGFFTSALDLLCIADTDGYFRRLNREWQNVTGFDLVDLEGRRFLDLIHPDDVGLTLKALEELRSQHEVWSVTNRYRCKDGSYRWLEWRSVPAGKCIYAAARDITERIRTEEALRMSETRLRSIGDNLPGGMIYQMIIAPDGSRRFTYISAGVEKMHEVTAAAVIKDATILYNQIVAEDLPKMIQEEERSIKQMAPFNVEARSCPPSGVIRWMKITSQPRILATGETVFDGVELDITPAKQTEQALRESEERFSKAFRANPAPMVITDLETGRFLDANDKWLDLIGYTREELIGATSLELNIYTTLGLRERMMAQLHREGSFKETDLCLRTKSGQLVDALWSAEIINLSGKEAMLSLLIDVTERKQAEFRLLESLGLLQATLESTANGILVTDLEQKIVNYNRRFMEMWRFPSTTLDSREDYLVLKTVLDQLVDPDSFIKGVKHIYANPKEERHEMILFKDGRIFERYSIPTYRGRDIVGRVWSFRDITVEKQAEEALRKSEMKYRRLHESITDAFVRVDMTGRLVETNKSFQEMVGYTKDELSQLSYEDLTPARWHALETGIINEQVLIRGYSDIYEKEYLRNKGTCFPVELRTYLIQDDDGQPIGMWAIVRDITARKQAEDALRESEALFRSQFQFGNIGIAITSPEKSWLRVNNRLCEMFGYAEEELLQTTWAAMTHPEDLDSDLSQFNRILAGEIDAYEIDKRFFRKDGTIIFTHLSVSCFLNQDHTVRFVIASLLDITETVKSIEKLRTSETTIRALMNATADALFVTDKDGNLLVLNTTLATRFGKTVKELTGSSIYSHLPPDLAETRQASIQEVIRSGQPVHFQDIRQGMWLENTFYPIFNNEGNVEMLAAYSRDITSRKQAEEQLEEALDFNRKIVSTSAVGIVVFENTGQCVSTNEAASSILGISASHMLEQNFNNIESWRKSGLVDLAQEVLINRKTGSTEINMVTSSGKEIWMACYLNWFINAGKPHLLVIVVDNTERKQAEIQLQQYHEHLEEQVKQRTFELSKANANLIRFRRFTEASGQGFGMGTLDGRITYVNATLARLTGEENRDKAYTRTFFDYYTDADREKLMGEIIPTVLKEGQWIGELPLTVSQGHTIPTIQNIFLIRDEQEHPSLLANVVTDIREMKKIEQELKKYRDHLEELVKKRTRELQKLNEELHEEISVRVSAEEALRESEQRYRTLFDSAPIGISVMKPDLNFEYFNPRFTEILGYTLEDLPNKDTWFRKAYPDPAYRNQVRIFWNEDLFRGKKQGGTGEKILKVRSKDGKDKVIHFLTAVMENGEHLMTYEDITELQKLNEELHEEITERIRAEEALRESELRYRTLFDSAPVAISVSTVDGSIEAMNDGLLQLMKVPSREEAFRLDPRRVYLDPEERERLMARINRDGFVHDYETRIKDMDDATKDVIMTMNRIAFDGKDAILSVIQDITWKKQAEEEAHHLRNYLTNIIDSMPSVLVGVDEGGHVTQWNIAAERETGIKAHVAKGKLIVEVLPFFAHQMELVRKAVHTRQPQSYPKMQSLIEGENRYTDITVYPLITNGVEGAVVRIDDVTDRIRLEEMMIQSEKMLSVGGLAAGMAHEINNPLGIVLAAAQNVLRRVSPELPANIKAAEACGVPLTAIGEYLEKRQILTFIEDIRNGVVRASQIVSNMLSFSRKAEEGGSPENLAVLLDQTVLLAGSDYDLKKKHDFRQIEIIREYDPATPPVLCQASKIQQVFLNILRNGAEALEEARTAERPSRFTLRLFPDGQWVQVEIEDNGPGMDEATRKRVFEPFFTTKSPGIGTGLGLSVSYFIITENHGGAISVKSTPGTGARFIIRLPAMEKRI